MTCEEYLSNMKPGYIVDGGSEEHLVMHELSQRAFSIYTDIRKLQDKAKTSYTLITEEVEVLI